MFRVGHLAARFAGSLLPLPVRAGDVAWVETVLTPVEVALWQRMPRADRREAVRVARRAEAAFERAVAPDSGGTSQPAARDDWLAAALLHDVGKIDARFGPYRRAVATAVGAAAPGMTHAWRESRGFTRRVGLYLDHATLGADRIRIVGGREVAARWAAAHHRPDEWPATGIPMPVCRLLAAADGEPVFDAPS